MTEGPNLQWEKTNQVNQISNSPGGRRAGLMKYTGTQSLESWQWPNLDRNWGWAPEFVKTWPEGFCISVQGLLQRGEQAAAVL